MEFTKKKLFLCGKCYYAATDTYEVVTVKRSINEKGVCGVCGRKRFGGTYILCKKKDV